jgi:hypothetical protein
MRSGETPLISKEMLTIANDINMLPQFQTLIINLDEFAGSVPEEARDLSIPVVIWKR